MKSVIEQMMFGERNVDDIKNTEEIKDLLDKLIAADKELRDKLPEELQQLYKNLTAVTDALNAKNSDLHYVEGFKFGLLLGVEAARE